jgi:hypothetical protein
LKDQQSQIPVYQPPPTGKAFVDMDGSEKMTFVGKTVLMLLTAGFAYPNVFVE